MMLHDPPISQHLTPQIFYSNRLEVLYQQLKRELFVGTHAFTQRMIL
ncbi:MAG: hypothetical protein H0X29_11425, partial [Parachlamydiaceae bacterium]|nr:hypothetical protein [Parachlamydiaceae bacterium]